LYAWPQGTACPVPKSGEPASKFKIPSDYTINPKVRGEEIDVPKARDFTAYKYKYFTLTSLNIFTAVCVTECPAPKFAGKKLDGNCIKTDNQGVALTPTSFGKRNLDFMIPTPRVGTFEKCKNNCFLDKYCNAFQFTSDGDCHIWMDTMDTQKNIVQLPPPVGDGTANE